MGDIVNINELMWAVVNFLIFLAIIRLAFWKPIIKMLEARREEIKNNLDEAARARQEAEELRVGYREQLSQAQRESQEVLNKAFRQAEEVKAEALDRAKKEAEQILEKAQEGIRLEKERAIADLRGEVASLAVMAAGKVIGKALSVEDHRKLTQDFIDEVGEVQ